MTYVRPLRWCRDCDEPIRYVPHRWRAGHGFRWAHVLTPNDAHRARPRRWWHWREER